LDAATSYAFNRKQINAIFLTFFASDVSLSLDTFAVSKINPGFEEHTSRRRSYTINSL